MAPPSHYLLGDFDHWTGYTAAVPTSGVQLIEVHSIPPATADCKN
jgi:hypothetical protein